MRSLSRARSPRAYESLSARGSASSPFDGDLFEGALRRRAKAGSVEVRTSLSIDQCAPALRARSPPPRTARRSANGRTRRPARRRRAATPGRGTRRSCPSPPAPSAAGHHDYSASRDLERHLGRPPSLPPAPVEGSTGPRSSSAPAAIGPRASIWRAPPGHPSATFARARRGAHHGVSAARSRSRERLGGEDAALLGEVLEGMPG